MYLCNYLSIWTVPFWNLCFCDLFCFFSLWRPLKAKSEDFWTFCQGVAVGHFLHLLRHCMKHTKDNWLNFWIHLIDHHLLLQVTESCPSLETQDLESTSWHPLLHLPALPQRVNVTLGLLRDSYNSHRMLFQISTHRAKAKLSSQAVKMPLRRTLVDGQLRRTLHNAFLTAVSDNLHIVWL